MTPANSGRPRSRAGILETYFGVDEEDVNVAPESIGATFGFGQATPQKAFDFGQGQM